MTATATASPPTRPALYLVPGTGRRRAPVSHAPGPAAVPRTVATLAAAATARVLGTAFTSTAADLARSLAGRSPLLVRRGRPEVWAAAIAFLLVEEADLFHYDSRTTRTSIARELGCSLPTLRRRGAEIRDALHPLVLDLPDPDDTA